MHNKKVKLDDQLADGRNWMTNGHLYLQHCVRCERENWAPRVAAGMCAWCGWSAPDYLPDHDLAKCADCGWLHFVTDDCGCTSCFHCGRKNFVKGKQEDAPKGATIQGVNRTALGEGYEISS